MSHLSRREMLRGLGVALSLPWFESLALAGGRAAATPPTRLAFVFMPNGVNYDAWKPIATPDGFTLSRTLEALAPVRRHVNIVTGLTLHTARANGDGPGDHARSAAAFLTACQARKTAGSDIRIGVSVDQVAAAALGRETPLRSIELGCEHGPSAGGCDSGYSCAYSNNISWRDASTPMAKIVDPAAAFERLFGDAANAAAAAQRQARRQSILDFVLEDSKSLANRLGTGDRRKLDQFETAVREVERRIAAARAQTSPRRLPDTPAPAGIPERASEHIDLMFDLLLLAFQTDTTRVASLMLAGDGSGRTFPEIGITEGHHHLSHHQNNQEMVEKIRRIDRFYHDRFARFVARMAEAREGDTPLLDRSLIVFGGGISDGNRHNHEDLPIVLAGRGGEDGGAIETGRFIQTPRDTPLANLYLSLLQRAGCDADRFGDSTSALAL